MRAATRDAGGSLARTSRGSPPSALTTCACPSTRSSTGLPLYCGEFGAISHAPDAIRAAWLKDFLAVMARHGIAWANWDFRGDFGLFTADNRKTVACSSLFET